MSSTAGIIVNTITTSIRQQGFLIHFIKDTLRISAATAATRPRAAPNLSATKCTTPHLHIAIRIPLSSIQLKSQWRSPSPPPLPFATRGTPSTPPYQLGPISPPPQTSTPLSFQETFNRTVVLMRNFMFQDVIRPRAGNMRIGWRTLGRRGW